MGYKHACRHGAMGAACTDLTALQLAHIPHGGGRCVKAREPASHVARRIHGGVQQHAVCNSHMRAALHVRVCAGHEAVGMRALELGLEDAGEIVIFDGPLDGTLTLGGRMDEV